MTCTEEYKEHIEYTFHAFCKIVIRNASYAALRTWSRKHKREISLDYLTDEKRYPLGTTDEYFKAPEQYGEYPITICGDTIVLYDELLAAALSCLPVLEREMVYLYAGEDGKVDPSSWHKIINVSEDARQKMFDNCKREFIAEYGVANGDTTKRSDVFREFQLSIPKGDRLKGTWTLQQYETAYNQAFYDAVKVADPSWKQGQPFDSSILNKVSREDIDKSLVKSGDRLLLPRKSLDVSV